MATTNIELDIENVTGVSDADDQFIISAQKFVVSSVPKNLLKWASSETSPSSHGGDDDPQQITLPVGTDSIISVRRDSYTAEEVPVEERGFIDNSLSLKKATNIFPKYYIADGNRVIVKPDPDSTYKGYAMYIDYSKLDDTSDLRNAVIFHACAKEFTQLATSAIPTWSDVSVPIAPTTPDFGSDLSISSTGPVVPTITAATVDSSSWSNPTYTKIVFSAPTLESVGDLTLPSIPVTPSLSTTTVSFSESVPTYTKPVLSLTSNPSITDLSISSFLPVSPASPSFDTGAISISSSAPTYSKPVFTAPTIGTVGS